MINGAEMCLCVQIECVAHCSLCMFLSAQIGCNSCKGNATIDFRLVVRKCYYCLHSMLLIYGLWAPIFRLVCVLYAF